MVRLSPNSDWNLSASKCAFEHGESYPKTRCSVRYDAGLLADVWGAIVVLALPVESIVRKRMSSCAVQCVSPLYPASLLGHCFGVKPTPGGRLVLLLRLAPPAVTVSICDGPTVNAELRPWESDPLARLRRV
jgi:hypothetical protein